MKHSDLQKDHRSNHGVACSGNRLCYACMQQRKKNKRINNKAIRNMNKKMTEQHAELK